MSGLVQSIWSNPFEIIANLFSITLHLLSKSHYSKLFFVLPGHFLHNDKFCTTMLMYILYKVTWSQYSLFQTNGMSLKVLTNFTIKHGKSLICSSTNSIFFIFIFLTFLRCINDDQDFLANFSLVRVAMKTEAHLAAISICSTGPTTGSSAVRIAWPHLAVGAVARPEVAPGAVCPGPNAVE